MAETAITAVLSKFGELASREAAVLLQVGDDIMLLRDRLEWLQAFIRDADRRRRVGADGLTRVWVRQTRDVAFEAEDALDEFFHKVDLESRDCRRWRKWCRYLTGFSIQITVRHGLSGQIQRIKSRLDQISENQKEYNIEHTPSGIWTSATTSLVAWNCVQEVVGFDDEVKSLKKLLLHRDHPQKMFISILGESGVGKSTLVQKILNDPEVENNFSVSIQYIMPPDCSTEKLLKEVYERACQKSQKYSACFQMQLMQGNDIADKLRVLLAMERYLLILGGISSKTMLNCAAASLANNKNGSRVVLIFEPESKEVACHAATLNLNMKGVKSIHQLSRLDEERSGRLFRLRVFGSEQGEMKDAMEIEEIDEIEETDETEETDWTEETEEMEETEEIQEIDETEETKETKETEETDETEETKETEEAEEIDEIEEMEGIEETDETEETEEIDETDETEEKEETEETDETEETEEIVEIEDAKEKEMEDAKEMERYEKDVYNITGGHPLAIVVLAGLLRSKEKPVEWDAVLQQLKPGMEKAQDGQLSKNKPIFEWDALHLLQQIMSPPAARESAKLSNRMAIERIFSSSFDDLPQDLKSCFLYFAVYPKNTFCFADQIVRMWTAEGFIRPQKGKTMEQLGYSYLKELVSRCLVELYNTDSNGDIERVRVHNCLLVFLQSEAREANFVEMHDRNDVLAPASVRRLSIQIDGGSYTTFTNNFPKLRSFICRVEEDEKQGQSSDRASKKKQQLGYHDLKFLCGSKFLRVLCVKGLTLQELPSEIGDMIHLRYLRVDCADLKKLPSSIRKLLNLQTLDVRNTEVEEIDRKFWLIKALRHVLGKSLTLPASVAEELGELQTLHGVKPAQGKWDEGSCPLDKMTNLRSLDMHGFKHEAAAALKSALGKMHLLGHLKLKGDKIPSCVFTEPSLRCLQTIVLDGAVEWSEIMAIDVSQVRPNLVDLKLKETMYVPLKIRHELKKMNTKIEIEKIARELEQMTTTWGM